MKKLLLVIAGLALAAGAAATFVKPSFWEKALERAGLAEPQPPVAWNVSLWGKRRAFTEHVERLAELVSERTGGTFTLNISYGGLGPPRENLDGIASGAFEMAQFCAGYHRDKNPTITVLELPFIGVSTLEEEVAVSSAVYDHPATREDLARWGAMPLMPSPLPQYNIAGPGKPRASIKDFKGMRVRAPGGMGRALRLVGAAPTTLTANEIYSALQSGIIETVAFAQHAHLSYRIVEIADWWTENLNPGTVNCPVVVNIEAHGALSESHRAALEGSIDEAMRRYLDNYADLLERWDSILEENSIERIRLPESEVRELERLAAAPVRDEWLEIMSARGIPARDLYDTMMDALAEARRQGG